MPLFTPNPHLQPRPDSADAETFCLAGVGITPDAIEAARRHLRGVAVRTPLLDRPSPDGRFVVGLKLESLQPIGSFKIRGGGAALGAAGHERLARGVYTASAGNMAQGVAWCARSMGVPCTVIVPEHAPDTKVAAVERLGGHVTRVPFDRWWQVLVERSFPGLDGLFVHPVADASVIAGNATIAREILEDVPDVDTVFVPFGGGGLACGIAIGMRALGSTARVVACEVETAAPFAAALRAGKAVPVEHRSSFVDGIGGRGMLTDMWPLAAALLAGTVVSTLSEIADAMRYLADRVRVIAEGAGAASVAAALGGVVEARRAVCVVSGGNIDLAKLATILAGHLPGGAA